MGVVVLAGLLVGWLSGEGGVDSLAERLGWQGSALLVGAQGLIAVSPFPSQLVAIPLAAMHGFALGGFLIWCGWMLAAVLQYGLSRQTAGDIDLDALLERTPRWIRRFPADHPAFLILARQLPIGPHIVNIVAGAMHVSLRRHLGCAAVGIVPQAALLSGVTAGIVG